MEPLPRLLLLVPELRETPNTIGELYNAKLAQGLRRHWDVAVATFDDLPDFGPTATAYQAAVTKYVNDHGPFAVIVQDACVYAFAAEANKNLLSQCPIVGLSHEVYTDRYKKPWEKWKHERELGTSLRGYRGLIATSEAVRRHTEKLKVPAGKLILVSPGHDLDGEAEPSPLAEPLRFVVAGSFHPSEGQLLAVEGMAEVLRQRPYMRSRIRLDLFGDQGLAPAYVQEIKRKIASAYLDGEVHLHGPLPQDQLWFEFARSHAFIYAATEEGLGTLAAEAGAFGCAGILCEDELPRGVVQAAKGSVLVPRQGASIASAIFHLLDDRPQWEELRRLASAGSELPLRKWADVVEEVSGEIMRFAGLADGSNSSEAVWVEDEPEGLVESASEDLGEEE